MPANNTGYYNGFMDYHQNAPVGDASDNVYYHSHQLQQHDQPTEYTHPHQANPSHLPSLLPHFSSVNDTTRFPGLQLPHPTQFQDTKNQAQYDNQYWVQWNTPRMSDSLQAEISPQIPPLIQDNPEPSHRFRDNEYMPPMGSSHKHTMPRLSGVQDEQENEPQATNKPTNHKSVVGMNGMPDPRPLCEFKQKFTLEDDEILRQLKHDCKDPYRLGSKDDGLTWRQIADFFPGRAPGTLQVHYCKEVSAKGPQWDAELDQKLIAAIEEYEKERWQIIAKKVKQKNYAAACEQRAKELQKMEQDKDQDQEEEVEEQEREMQEKRKTQGKKRKM